MKLRVHRRVLPSTGLRYPWVIELIEQGNCHRIAECELHAQALTFALSVVDGKTPLLDAAGAHWRASPLPTRDQVAE